MNCLIFKLEEIRRGAYHRVYDTGYVPFLFFGGEGSGDGNTAETCLFMVIKEHKGKLTSRSVPPRQCLGFSCVRIFYGLYIVLLKRYMEYDRFAEIKMICYNWNKLKNKLGATNSTL